jgi:CRP-like cAMP-binding protein
MKKHRGIPSFKDLDEFDPYALNLEKQTKVVNFDMMVQVAILEIGTGFGELALMNDEPRSATIDTIEDCQFATLSKNDFKEVMDKVYKRKFAAMVSFLSSFSFLSHLTRKAKEKL